MKKLSKKKIETLVDDTFNKLAYDERFSMFDIGKIYDAAKDAVLSALDSGTDPVEAVETSIKALIKKYALSK